MTSTWSPVSLSGPDFTHPATNLQSQGRALDLQLAGGSQQATLVTTPDKNLPDAPYPAIISHPYGQGKALTFAFDLVSSLQTPVTPDNQAAANDWKILLLESLSYLQPAVSSPAGSREYRIVTTEIKNLASDVDLSVTTRLPAGAALLSSQPLATLDSNGNPLWTFALPANQSQALTLALRLPATSGSYRLETAIDSIRNGITRHYGDYALSIDIAAALDSATGWSGDLAALVVNQSDHSARDHAVTYLNDALTLANSGLYSSAVDKLVNAIEALRQISSIDVSPYRLKLDQLLREMEYHAWCGATSPQPSECAP